MKGEVAAKIQLAAKAIVVDELKLLQVTRDLVYASPVSISRHFLIIMNQLIRTMLAGTGNMSELYSNPFKHDALRCEAFLAMLRILGKIANDGTNTSGPLSTEKLFLHTYVDYILDEELPLELQDRVNAGAITQIKANEIAIALEKTASLAAVNAAAAAVSATTPIKDKSNTITRTKSHSLGEQNCNQSSNIVSEVTSSSTTAGTTACTIAATIANSTTASTATETTHTPEQ